MSDAYASLLIATVVLLIMLFVWPGVALVKPRDIAGRWSSRATGGMFELLPGGQRAFRVVQGGRPVGYGWMSGQRGVVLVDAPEGASGGAYGASRRAPERGHVAFGGRQIRWGSDTWVRQGVGSG
jgi:hypothetical protein